MRTIVILFTLFYFLNALAVAPYGFKGQQQSTTLYSNVLQGQNNLVTNMGGINALLETGNKNILTNPSFEHATFSTGWTNSAGTFTADTVVEVDGLKAAKLVLSAQTMSLTQSSTLYAAQFADGVQGLASVRVKSDVALKVCSIQAGTVSTTNCVDVVANNKWGLYKVPFIFGATSQGISIASSGSVTGTIYIDDAFVGAVDLKTEGMIVRPQSSLATGALGAGVAFTGSYTTTNSGVYTDSAGVITVTKAASFNIAFSLTSSTTTTVVPEIRINGTAVSGDNSPVVLGQKASSAYNAILAAGTTISFANSGPGAASAGNISLTATSIENGSVYTSTNSDTDWASCGLTGAAFTGFGSSVPTPSLQCKRQGSDLLIKGTFQAGTTPTAVEARMALPTWNGVQLVSANSSIIPRVQLAGNLTINLSNTTFFGEYVLIEASVPYVTFALQSSVANADTKATGANLSGTGNFHSINARIPIEGWQGSNIIVGSFSGLQNCTSTLACTDTFSLKVSSAGVVSDENVDWINGNCTVATGTYTCNFNSSIFTVAPNCVASSNNTPAVAASGISVIGQTVSAATVYTYDNVQGPRPFSLICQKQGADYVGKTALAVASDQNIRTPGVTKAVVYSAFIGAAGTVSSELGDLISGSCTVASTNVFTCSFTAGIFASDPLCQLTVMGASGASRSAYIVTNPTTSGLTYLTYNTTGPTATALNVMLTCHGVSP